AVHLDRNEASRRSAELAIMLTGVMADTIDDHTLDNLAKAFSAVAAHLAPQAAGAILTVAMTNTPTYVAQRWMAKCLHSLLAGMDSLNASRLSEEAAKSLMQAMTLAQKWPDQVSELAQCISAFAARVDSQQPAEAAHRLTEVMINTTKEIDLPK